MAVTIVSTAFGEDHFDFNYRLDGTPTQAETRVRTPAGPTTVPTTLKAEPRANGQLQITIDRELKMPGGQPVKGSTVEQWKLDAGGKILTIDRVDETPRGRMEATMVFTAVN